MQEVVLEASTAQVPPAPSRAEIVAARRAAAAKAERDAVRARWDARLAKIRASSALQITGPIDGLDDRSLWLIFAVVEHEEKCALAGRVTSAQSRWYDGIAPRALKKGETYQTARGLPGVSGFTSRYAGKAARFLRLSGNGYVWAEDAGVELVLRLRELHPHLAPNPEIAYQALPVPSLDLTLPNTRWRVWKD